MATVDEILAAEFGNDDVWFEVDLASRQIIIPKTITNLGVKSDADVVHVRFKLPRFYYGVDFADFKIGIDYMNAKGVEDRYEPEDVTVSADVLTFTWIVGRNAALFDGNVTFGLCVKRLNPADPADPLNEFHTTKASLPILDGMETCEEAVIMHTDLLEQWRAQLFGEKDSLIADINTASQNEQNAIQEKGIEVLATIPEDYAETFSMINHADRTKADAILCSVEGEIISIADASDDHVRNLRVFGKTTQVRTTGKNLADPNFLPYGFASNADLGPVIGENATEYRTLIAPVTHGQVYTVSRGAALGSRFRYGFTTEYPSVGMAIYNSNIAYADTYDAATEFTTIPAPEGYNYLLVYLTNINSTEHVENTWYQVELGTEATAYEPYSGGKPAPSPEYPQELDAVKNTNVSVCGVNLLPFPYAYDSADHSGAKMTILDDGGIKCEGTPTDYVNIILHNGPLVQHGYLTFTMFGDYENVSMEVSLIDEHNTMLLGYTGTKPYTVNMDDYPTTKMVRYGIKLSVVNETMSGTVYPMITVGEEIPEQYEPYTVQSITVPYTLRAIPVAYGSDYTDANGQQWVRDEVDFDRGVYIKRVGEGLVTIYDVADLTGLGLTAPGGMFSFSDKIKSNGVGSMSDKLIFSPDQSGLAENVYYENLGNMVVVGADGDTFDSLTNKFNGTKILYCLDTPIETPLTASEIEAFKALRTIFPNTTVFNDEDALMKFVYNADTRTYLDRLPKATDEQVQASVDTWLEQHFQSAEGVSF